MSDLKVAIGTLSFEGTEATKQALEVIKSNGIKEIDTAHMYGAGQNETDLGNAGVSSLGFEVSTKNMGGWAAGKALKREAILATARESLDKLQLKQLDIFYIHGPDRTMKVAEWVPTIQELYEKGVFQRFGVSNFSPEEVRELYDYCKSKAYILPTVYQGNYNAVARKIEDTLFPVLRELGIAFYAYSPLAGGFLAKSKKAIEEGTSSGRFSTENKPLNAMYRSFYEKPTLIEALGRWEAIADKAGMPKNELAYRWVYYHSALNQELGDTLIMGASKVEQITSSAEGLKRGPLDKNSVDAINGIWELVKNDAITDNFDAQT